MDKVSLARQLGWSLTRPDSTRLQSTLVDLNQLDSLSFSLSLSLLFFLPRIYPFSSSTRPPSFAQIQLDPLQFGSHKLAAIHLALVLKRESRLVGRHEIKSPLSPAPALPHSPSHVSPSPFQPDSSVHIRLGVKDRTYLEQREYLYTRGKREG